MPEPKQDALVEYNEEFLKRIRQLKKDLHKKYVDIGTEKTPLFDGSGREIVKKRPDGYDYIIEGYMRKKLDQYFPGWSWEGLFTQFLVIEWVWVGGHLIIPDEYLLVFRIIPPVRKFFGLGASRIQFKSNMPHTVENIIDIGNNLTGANGKAFKYAVNRLTNIGDDIYGKRIDEEGAGNIEDIIASADTSPNIARDMFFKYLSGKKILHSKAQQILGVKSWSEITDWKEAYNKVKE